MKRTPQSRRVLLQRLLAAPLVAPLWSHAQTPWPERDLRLLVPVPPGGIVDLSARAVAEQLRVELGRAVIVDNRGGAGGLIGTKALAQAPADGYTLGYLHAGLVTVQAMGHKLDLLKELRLLGRVSHSPFALAVRADAPYKSAAELLAAVRANPGKLNYGSGGVGSPAHLAVEMVEERSPGFSAVHVPFKSALESATAVVAGQVDFTLAVLGSLVPLVQGGKLRLLAVTTEKRLDLLPQVPTFTESALPGFVFEPWGGYAVPAGTPDGVVERLARAVKAASESAASRDLAQKSGSLVQFFDGRALAAQIARDLPVETALVKRLGMVVGQ